MSVSVELFGISQWFSSFCLLGALCRWSARGNVPWLRVSLCAALGTALTMVVFLFGGGISYLLSALMLDVLLPMLALGQLPRLRRLRTSGLYLLLNVMLEGGARLAVGAGVPALPGMLAASAMLLALPRLMQGTRPLPVTKVEIRWRGRSVCLSALMDSGNLLRDPVTELPVIVCSHRAVEHILPRILPGMLPVGFRYLSVRTAAGGTLMPCFRPESVRLLLAGGWVEAKAVIGLTMEGYSGFQALVPAALTSGVAAARAAAAALPTDGEQAPAGSS